MTRAFDLVVIGAGPAGAAAALAAALHGLSVGLVDESVAAGGQVYRAPAPGAVAPRGKHDPDAASGDALRAALAASDVQTFFGRRVWAVADGFSVEAVGEQGPQTFTASCLIAATGAHERVVPFRGWTLPGVIGLAAATILIKSQGMLPGRRVVVAGCGPLLVAVAAKIVAAGGELAAVVDLSSRAEWILALPGLIRRPRSLARGAAWMRAIGRASVPVVFRHAVTAAEGRDRVERVVIGPVDRDGAPTAGHQVEFDVDTLVVGHGLVPGAEIPRLLRARMHFDPLRGGWVPQTDDYGETSIRGLFAIGDGAGIRGAEPAALSGQIAGLAVARRHGRLNAGDFARLTASLQRQQRSYLKFSDAVAAPMALRAGHVRAISADTIVCRCEDVTRAQIEAAARDGAADVNQMKHFTRCGMGPCQGRMCGDVAAELLAQARGMSRETVGFWSGRPPLRPVPLSDLIGVFNYSDIPIPKPAPL